MYKRFDANPVRSIRLAFGIDYNDGIEGLNGWSVATSRPKVDRWWRGGTYRVSLKGIRRFYFSPFGGSVATLHDPSDLYLAK